MNFKSERKAMGFTFYKDQLGLIHTDKLEKSKS